MITKTIGTGGDYALRGHWAGEDNTVDSVGGNDAVWNGTPSYSAGFIGNAFVVNNPDNFIEIPYSHAQSLTSSNDWTLELYFKKTVLANGAIFTRGVDSADHDLFIGITNTDNILIRIYGVLEIDFQHVLFDDTWQSIKIRCTNGAWRLWVDSQEKTPAGSAVAHPADTDSSFWMRSNGVEHIVDEIKISTNNADYSDINSAINALVAANGITDDSDFNLISNVNNNTEIPNIDMVTANTIPLRGHALRFNLNGFTVFAKKRMSFDFFSSIYSSPADYLGSFRLHNGKIFFTDDSDNGDQIKLWYGSAYNYAYEQLIQLDNLIISDHLKTVDSTDYQVTFWQDSAWCFPRLMNLRMYKKMSGYALYVSGNGSGFDPAIDVRYKHVENCSIYHTNASTGILASTGSTYLNASFKNVVVAKSEPSLFQDFQYTDNAGVSFVNCADSDDSIADHDTGTVHGITDADFVSVDPTSEDFLKIAAGSKLFTTGTSGISAWNTADIVGHPRPNAQGLVSIGVFEPIMSSRRHGITAATYQRIILDAGQVRVNYVDADNPGFLLGATRGGSAFTIEPEYHRADVDGAKGPVKGDSRIAQINARMQVNALEIVPWVLSIAIPGATTTESATHSEIKRSLRILLSNYNTSIALLANISGSDLPVICILKNALSDGGFGITLVDADETTLKIQFTAHFDPATMNAEPWEIRYPL